MRVDQSQGKYVMALIRVIKEASSISEGCRLVGVHRSTYYRWMVRVERGLAPVAGGRGRNRMHSPGRVRLESEVIALALANPPWGPNMLFHHLVAAGVEVGSASMVWRILERQGLNTAPKRYALMRSATGFDVADTMTVPSNMYTPPVGVLKADIPGDLVQIDCFHIGRVKGAKIAGHGQGTVWQYTAIDVASSYVWAELHTTRHSPSPVLTTALAHKVATELAQWGWTLTQVSTDNGNEFVANLFKDTLESEGVTHRRIRPGRPQSNGKVEGVQGTILRELWQPTFTTYAEPTISGLRQDLDDYLAWYNNKRPHTGRWNKGKPPIQIIEPNTGNYP